jgi:energy-coupling factor transporter ATP-binding protein EcfA2
MKIVKLEAENVKRLRAVEITPDGNVVVIAGRNAQGKSSVLDSIWMALAGGSASKETTKPIRDGEKKATARIDLGDLIVTRTWSGDKTRLKVESAEGARFTSPQQMLDGLVGRLSFDPLAFTNLPAKDQLATLLDLVELPFDPADLDRRRAGIFEKRTDVNRQVKTLTAQVEAIPTPDPDLPESEVSAGEILVEVREAQDTIRWIDDATAQHDGARSRVETLRLQLEDAEAELAGAQAAIEALPDRPDVSAIEAQLDEIESRNALIRQAAQRRELVRQLIAVGKQSEQLTGELEAIDETKATALTEAVMPIDGLSFDADGVTYQGVPFKQASAAEQLRVSLAMAMALNPEIRVIRITDGSLLDSTNLALISEMADAHDFQVWVERVDETGTVGVVIEDGLVAGAPIPEPLDGRDLEGAF